MLDKRGWCEVRSVGAIGAEGKGVPGWPLTNPPDDPFE